MPFRPVKTSPTKKGWDRKRWILRARDTVMRSSSDSSSRQDGDDVLQLAEALEDLLHPPGHGVVAVAHHLGGEDVAGRGQRVDRRVDAEGGDLAGQLGGGVE